MFYTSIRAVQRATYTPQVYFLEDCSRQRFFAAAAGASLAGIDKSVSVAHDDRLIFSLLHLLHLWCNGIAGMGTEYV